jgi:hypothetical protein
MSTIPEHGLGDAKHKKIKRILPATLRRSKQPAVAGMHPDGAKQDRRECQRNPAGLDAQDKQQST